MVQDTIDKVDKEKLKLKQEFWSYNVKEKLNFLYCTTIKFYLTKWEISLVNSNFIKMDRKGFKLSDKVKYCINDIFFRYVLSQI